MGCDGESVGAMLKAARQQQGVSLTRMAQLVPYVKPYLSQLENGKRPVTHEHVQAYERALGITGLVEDMDRRALLTAMTATAASEPLSRLLDGLMAPEETGRIGATEVAAVRESTNFYSSMDLQYGGKVAARVAGESLRWAVGLLDRSMDTTTRRDLSSAVASLADRLAWSYHDSGQKYPTRRMSELSLQASSEGDDPTLAAHIRLDVSSFMEDKPTDAAAVLTGVHETKSVHPLERANVAAVRARHLGNAGHLREARNLLGTAEALVPSEWPDGIPGWAGFLSEPHIMRVLGRSYYSIGDLDRAADRFQRAAEGFGPDRGRGRAQVMTRLGYVYLAQGDVDAAKRQAQDAETALEGVSSARASENLRELQRHLSAA